MATIQGLVPVPDDDFAQAYDAVDASLRARLKTSIALHHSMLGVAPSLQRTHTERATAGFNLTEERRPISWAMLVLAESFASGARLLAALMPALCAGITDICVVRLVGDTELNEKAWPDVLLASLELAGQENVFTGTVDAVLDFVHNKPSCGRLLFLGDDAKAKSQLVHGLAKTPQATFGPTFWPTFWSEGPAPRLYVEKEQGFDMDQIRWAHPDCLFCSAFTEAPNAVYSNSQTAFAKAHTLSMAPLILTKGCESLWMYRDLHFDFFMQDTVTIGLSFH